MVARSDLHGTPPGNNFYRSKGGIQVGRVVAVVLPSDIEDKEASSDAEDRGIADGRSTAPKSSHFATRVEKETWALQQSQDKLDQWKTKYRMQRARMRGIHQYIRDMGGCMIDRANQAKSRKSRASSVRSGSVSQALVSRANESSSRLGYQQF